MSDHTEPAAPPASPAHNSNTLDSHDTVFMSAVKMTRMPMLISDPSLPDNPIIFVNHAFLELSGYTEAEMLGRNCRFLQGERTDRDAVRELREAIAERRPCSVEMINYRKNGTPFWNALFVGPVFSETGELKYFFGSQLDISRRRASEDALRQSQKMEAIGQLTAGLAHDFNNMLQVMSGNLQAAEERLEFGDVTGTRLSIDKAERAISQAAKLTQQLLTFARKTRLQPRPISLNAMLADFGDMLADTLGEGVALRLDLDPKLPLCVLDPTHAEMAVLNVLVNARDAMPDGGEVTLTTRTVQFDEAGAGRIGLAPGRYVALALRDQGVGMDSSLRERAVEPFFTTKALGRGTGLGLAMVHGFTRQSGGALEIESEPGRGTLVRLLFPVSVTATTDAQNLLDEPALPRRGHETVLVVDDSPEVLEIATNHLRSLGFQAVSVGSGEEALQVLRSGQPRIDLLFTDIAMPGGINGLVLAEQARRLLPDLPVVLATGYVEELVAGGSQPSDMDVLGKPYRRAELGERVRKALDRPILHRD